MKSLKILVTGLLFFGASAIYAQNEADNKTDRSPSFGVKGGVNFSNVIGDDIGDTSSRTNFHVGVVGELPLADIFSLQAEVLYSGQGFKAKNPVLFGADEAVYKLDYINVPVLAKVYITKGLSIEAGPQFGFKVNEKVEVDGEESDELENAESFDFAVAGGLTFQTEMGLFATGRYTYGFTDVVEDADTRNQVFQIGIGYKF
ncbi:PorT family protein [Flavobacterium sp. MAH-1]|uniref:PorT family protein n=1 Tax=Flavobacterium agri TaxID=2743471 RepID=A0A7Y8Y3T3_9FLAO|nr:porin family protein [Flavobacterium agri]NUY82060.1 PorT family protein [Flavobacterium agri]NYA72084.1 PorT family protein [Flavobacterium agri]